MNSNLVACKTGRSAGLALCEDAADIDANLAEHIGNVGPVAHQHAIDRQESFAKSLAGIRSRVASVAIWRCRLAKKPSGAMNSASARALANAANAASISAAVLALKKSSSRPKTGSSVDKGFCGCLCCYGIARD